jgi:serine/threonine protein kinase
MGLVHRDLKPANIFVVESSGTSNFIKVLDFGISKPLKEMFISEDEPESLTQTGIILGTPFYMAPEQASGITSRSADLYSLGVILHECLTGKRPFTGSSPLEVIMQHMNKEPPALSDKVPQDLQNLIFSLMAKQPTERPKDAKAVLDLLHDIGSGALTGESHDTVVDVSLNLANIETSELLQVNPHGSAGLSEITPALPQTVTEALDPFATTEAPASKTQNTRRLPRLQGLWIPAGLVLIAIATTSFTIHRIRDSRGLEDGMKVLPGAITKQIETVRRDAGSDPGAGQTQGPVSDPVRPVIEAESTDPPPPAQPKTILHSFSILTLPPNAMVQIKPKKMGSLWSDPRPSPIEIKVPEGTYELRVRKSDYKTRRKTFLVKSDTRTTIKLQPDLGDL